MSLFTPIILICLDGGCMTISGPAFDTEQACFVSIMEVGIPTAVQRYGVDAIADVQCVKWDPKV